MPITSRALADCEGYPLRAVIYAAIVSRALDPREYYKQRGAFRSRPDCIYVFDRAVGTLQHSGKTRLHDHPAYAARDIGRFPYYKNARTLLSEEFRYFGANAVPIPERLPHLAEIAESLGQGHRVFHERSPQAIELDALFKILWKLPTRYTPARVEEEARGHTPRGASNKSSKAAVSPVPGQDMQTQIAFGNDKQKDYAEQASSLNTPACAARARSWFRPSD